MHRPVVWRLPLSHHRPQSCGGGDALSRDVTYWRRARTTAKTGNGTRSTRTGPTNIFENSSAPVSSGFSDATFRHRDTIRNRAEPEASGHGALPVVKVVLELLSPDRMSWQANDRPVRTFTSRVSTFRHAAARRELWTTRSHLLGSERDPPKKFPYFRGRVGVVLSEGTADITRLAWLRVRGVASV